MPTTTIYDEMKATLKAELKAELSAEFNEELHKLRQEVENLRATFRAPPHDDVVDVEDAAPYGTQETASEESTQDYNTSNGFPHVLQAAVCEDCEGKLVAGVAQKRVQGGAPTRTSRRSVLVSRRGTA